MSSVLRRWPLIFLVLCGCQPKVSGVDLVSPDGGGDQGRMADDAGFGFTVPDAGAQTAPPPLGENGACVESTVRAQLGSVDLLAVIDTSDSMAESAGGRSKWAAVQEALTAFARDPRSAGLKVGLLFFPRGLPQKACTVDGDCVTPAVAGACRDHDLCVRPGVSPEQLLPCLPPDFGDRCALGGTCQQAGLCSRTLQTCVDIDRPCPGAMPDDICRAAPRLCIVRGDDANGCEPAQYEAPDVPLGILPGNETVLTRVIAERKLSGGTPTSAALGGAYRHLRAQLAMNPGRRGAVILATDGLPTGCLEAIPAIAGRIGDERTGAPPITTYVIGVFTREEAATARPALQMFATAGGTGMPFLLTAAGDLGTRLQEALAQIRGEVRLPCELAVPTSGPAGPIDFGRVNVRFQPAGGPAETVPYVERADRCDPVRGGWYYDVNPAAGPPGRILVCEATCTRWKAQPEASVTLAFGCRSEVIK